jgi:hypothetical protein
VLYWVARLDREHLKSPRHFSLTRIEESGNRSRAGLKGATRWRTAGDASTATSEANRESPPTPASRGFRDGFRFSDVSEHDRAIRSRESVPLDIEAVDLFEVAIVGHDRLVAHEWT